MTPEEQTDRITAYVLGELHGAEREAFERLIAEDPALRAAVATRLDLAHRVQAGLAPSAEEAGLSERAREAIRAAAGPLPLPLWQRQSTWLRVAATLVAALLVGGGALLLTSPSRTGDGADTPGLRAQASILTAATPDEEDLEATLAETPDVLGETEVIEALETDNDLPYEESLGEDGLSDAPFQGPANGGLIGLGGGAGGRFRGRQGGRPLAGARWGSPESAGDASGTRPPFNTEGYDRIRDNPFFAARVRADSTFSIDVDTASYANVRRFLQQEGRLPTRDAVRIEELVNYFPYAYAPPADDAEHPFVAHARLTECPWEPTHRLLRVALQGRVPTVEARPAVNLVFLLDVSGSMNNAKKLPLLQRALGLLVDQLRPDDRVAIVVYAGAAGLVLPSTPGSEKAAIRAAIDRLHAGGSTNGGAGIQLAYATAKAHLVEGGVNRVILCTDGDFNVGISDSGTLVRHIQDEAKSGVFLTVLGFGSGNYQDGRMEELSNHGNGNYAYVDTMKEARKVLVEDGLGTLITIAKDVKIQLYFNPRRIAGWRLIGYENRLLQRQDFNDDTKDAGEIGAGHAVTALYEIVPVGVEVPGSDVDPNPFLAPPSVPLEEDSDALLLLRLRYKQPDADESTLMETFVPDRVVPFAEAGDDFQWASAVAGFGMMLRDSEHKGQCTWALVEEVACAARGEDRSGYRAEFLQLVRLAASLDRR